MDYAAPAILNTYFVQDLVSDGSGFQSACTGDDYCAYDDGLAS
jgi:hypothetical protein